MRGIACARCRAKFAVVVPGHLLGRHRFRRCRCGDRLLPRTGLDRVANMSKAELEALGIVAVE
ncbi:hypothetical protein [Aeromonas phage 3]|nr:hypothetical protein [Aeromonas phage 3]